MTFALRRKNQHTMAKKKKIPKTFSKQMSTYFHLKFIVKMSVLKKKTEKVFMKRFGESKIPFKHSKQEGKKS